MAKPILMPQVGQDLTEGKLIEWRIKVGDTVGKGDIVAVVESEKASFEVEAFESGTVLELLYEEGATTEVLAPLAFVGEPGEKPGAAPAPPVVSAPSAQAPTPLPATPPAAAEPLPDVKAGGKTRSSPLARRLARDATLDLASLKGSGPQGAVVKRDVEAALVQRSAIPAPAVEAPAATVVALPASRMSALVAAGTLHRVWLRKGTGDPLVLIHGFGADLNAWRVLVATAALSRPVLALDLPGHGGSPLAGAFVWDDVVAAIGATLKEEGIEAADLVGHSLGAALAVSVAEAARFTLRSLFLISPAGLGPDVNGAFVLGYVRSTNEASLAPWMKLLVADETVIGPAFVKVTAETRAAPGVAEAQQRIAQAIFPDGTQVVSVRKALAGLPCPVRIVFGAEDRIIPPRHVAGLPGTIGVHLFPGIGHMPQIEAREPVARLLTEHLRSAG